MKIKEISYGFTKNIGNFESERLDLTVELTDEDQKKYQNIMDLLQKIVHTRLGIEYDEKGKRIVKNEFRNW